MNDIPTLGSAPHQAAWSGPCDTPRRRYGLAMLPRMIATWRQRIYFRRDLEEMAKANPHLIDDIGMKKWQVETEIAKHFWER
ncbi:DUF1127 domain-containing protein [Labrys sp. KNU-23]|uniref:DUF1127 domain-containing protein n=1 Tax=Labrys sp. KNU-23 TaxID=2789216 RepID=UPI0011EBA230|nr:DUF1127 domain-containing protein [Labrys sp. KNU-23]QEN87321.1 DUF1127 domain-containing protein [Labrys sp. KNU-23]